MIFFNQTSILLILFFASLISIVAMMWRKIHLLRSGQTVPNQEVSFGIQHLEKVKHLTIANIKKYEHIALEGIVRGYIKSANFSKEKYNQAKVAIKSRINRNPANGEKKEISKFLKVIGDYKQKIREIKHKITKEENL